MNYQDLKERVEDTTKAAASAIDNAMTWMFGTELVNKPTKYKGKGRPKTTDYAIERNTITGETRKRLHR